MKEHMLFDIGKIMDSIFETAQNFGDVFKEGFKEEAQKQGWDFGWQENVDYYPTYMYPPVNVFMTREKSLVFEFAVAGFNEKDINLEFSKDHMIFSANAPERTADEDAKYFKHRIKFKEIPEQRYFVPEDKFNREAVKAVFKNGILKVTIPPKEEIRTAEGIKVEIVREEE
ncbi:MAG: Hsp20/alpha crystallin family protein [Spirochaetales bacterium]|nr:MAG: Hsp20/alpha crystallin family protein [Spirochaetales bacterium]